MSNTRIAILGFEIPSVEEITPLLKRKRIIETPEPWLVKQGKDIVVNGCFKYVEHGVIYTAPVKDKRFKIYLRPKMMLGDAFEPSFGAKARQFGSLWSGTGKFFLLDNPIPVVFEKMNSKGRVMLNRGLKTTSQAPNSAKPQKQATLILLPKSSSPQTATLTLRSDTAAQGLKRKLPKLRE